MSEQLSLNFNHAPDETSGLLLWREQRQGQMEALAKRSGLPIGHLVRLWLSSGVCLEGQLKLASEELWIDQRRSVELRLQIGRADFCVAEIDSCVRVD